MGLTKRRLEEEQERQYSAPDRYVCYRCVTDSYLKDTLQYADNTEHLRSGRNKRLKCRLGASASLLRGPIGPNLDRQTCAIASAKAATTALAAV